MAGENRFGVAQLGLAFVQVLLLATWLGSMLFFSFAVAPSAFAVLPSRHMAGTLVTSVLSKVEILGLLAGPILVLLLAAAWRGQSGRATIVIRTVLIALMTASAAVSRYVFTPTLKSLRDSMGDLIDNVPVDNPLRIQFNDLHHYSVGVMSVAIFAGLVALFLTVQSWLKR